MITVHSEGVAYVWENIYLASVRRVRTACTSLPVLIAHCEDFLYPVIHGFGKLAELLAFLFPVDKGRGQVNMQSAIHLLSVLSVSGFSICSSFRIKIDLTHTSTRSRSEASGSIVVKIITPTVSSFSAFLFPIFQSCTKESLFK